MSIELEDVRAGLYITPKKDDVGPRYRGRILSIEGNTVDVEWEVQRKDGDAWILYTHTQYSISDIHKYFEECEGPVPLDDTEVL